MNPRLEVLDAIYELLDQLEQIQGATRIAQELRTLMDEFTTQSDIDFLCERVRDLEASVRYFGNERKPERELWMVRTFLRAFRTPFDEVDLTVVPKGEEPPDVRFHKHGPEFAYQAEFECKEVPGRDAPDDGYKRHTLFKAKLEEAKAMLADAKKGGNIRIEKLAIDWKQEAMSSVEAAEYAMHKARDEASTNRYSPSTRAVLDLLVYVNLTNRIAVLNTSTFDGSEASSYGWRSISFVSGMCAGILFAARDAPAFIIENVGKLIYRDPRFD